MGYFLQAFIGRQNDLKPIIDKYHNACSINVGQDIAIVPMTEDLYDEINQMNVSDGVSTFMYLTKSIETEILNLIDAKNIGYIEAEYHGGQGGQTAIIWTDRQRSNVIEYGQGAINSVLKRFGVVTDIGKDEFDTLNFGRYRQTNDWLKS
jgi:hypothetical protein